MHLRHSRLLATAGLLVLSAIPAFAQDQQEFTATLVTQAILPAATFVQPPADAPASLSVSGKYTAPDRHRVTALGTVPGLDGNRPTGMSLPFAGQPIQGFSGIAAVGDGTYWSLSDNGFGSKLNSVDTMLMLHHIGFDWDAGTVNLLGEVFLKDPNSVVPFPIVNEGTTERYLTGADLDIESIQPVADGFWVGDEFGPYLIKVDLDGVVTGLYDTTINGTLVQSPDNQMLTLPGTPDGALPAFNLKRSGGFEGLAQSPDGAHLYGLLEGSLWVNGAPETVDGHQAIRIAEFDPATTSWTGRSWLYPFEDLGVSIGDFNMVDATHALVIERDNGAGLATGACPNPQEPQPDCFSAPAAMKRIYLIEFGDDNVGGAVRKIGYIDLLNIQDPNAVARQGTVDGVYTMPFVTIENVDVVDATHIIVGNDNNLPFSAGRSVNQVDDTEFNVLDVGDFLSAQ